MNSDELTLVRYAASVLAICGAIVAIGGSVWCLSKVIQHIRKTVPTAAYIAGPLILFSRYVDVCARRQMTWFWRWVLVLALCMLVITISYPFPEVV